MSRTRMVSTIAAAVIALSAPTTAHAAAHPHWRPVPAHTTLPAPTPPAPRAGVPCPSPAACGFPTAATTGPRQAPRTKKSGDLTITTNGTVIRGWDLHGSIDVWADNVTIIDTKVTSRNWWGVNLRAGHKGLRVLHSTITGVFGQGPDESGGEDYGVSNMGGGAIEVGWNDISVFPNSISMGQGYIHDNYVHGIRPYMTKYGWTHTDPVISDGGGEGQLLIQHNTLINASPIDNGASAAVGLFADVAPVTNSVVDRNWLAGGAYALYGGGKDSAGIKVTGNVFSSEVFKNSGFYGQVAYWNPSGAGNVWRDNRTAAGAVVIP